MQVRHSRVTRQAYVFEVERLEGSMWCYRARLPTPGTEFEAFNILSGVGEIWFEVDSSSNPEFDFDISCFKSMKK